MAGEWDVVGERAAPKKGGGEWDVVGEAPFQPAQQKRQVGAGEAFVDDLKAGSSKIGRDVIAAVGSPLLAVDAAANKLVGHETGASEWWAENVFGPYQRFVDNAAAKRAETQRSIPVELAGAAGGLVTSTPEMIAGSKAAQAMKVAEGIPALGQLLTRAFAAAQPMSARAGADRFADVKAMGADDLAATNAALGTYANTTAQGMAPMGAPGGVVKRAVTGAAVNPVMAAAGRSAENAINSTSGDPRLQQQVASPEQAIVDAVMGAGMHGVMGEKGRASQSPEAVAADRTNWNNSHDAETVMANRTVTPDAAPLTDIIAAATGAKNRPESVAEWQQQQQTERAATAQRANELRSTFKGVDLPKDPAVPATKEQAVRQAYEEQGIDPDSTLTAIKRGYAADGMDLPPTVREGVAKENSDALARQAFALADRRQKQADADLANSGQLAHDYQGGASAAHGGELDSGIRRVTLLDGEVPVEIVAHDGKTATVSIEQNGKTIEFDVQAKRLTEHDLPTNQRLAQDYRARSSEPARGVGVETMAGEKMPRRSTDRIAGDEIGGLTTPYDPRQKDGGRVEGDVLQPAAGTDIAPRAGARQGDTINGTASRQTAGFEPQNSQRQIGERRALEAPRRAEQRPMGSDVLPREESSPERATASREPHQQTAEEWHKQHIDWLLSKLNYPPKLAAEARKSPVAWSDHADFLETALENGKTIPSRVLDDYRASGKSFDQAEYPLLSKRLAGGENMPAAGQTQQQQPQQQQQASGHSQSSRTMSSQLLADIRRNGGIAAGESLDITGDNAFQSGRKLPGVFKKSGLSADGLLELLQQRQWLGPDATIADARAMVRDAFHGREVSPFDDASATARLDAQAESQWQEHQKRMDADPEYRAEQEAMQDADLSNADTEPTVQAQSEADLVDSFVAKFGEDKLEQLALQHENADDFYNELQRQLDGNEAHSEERSPVRQGQDAADNGSARKAQSEGRGEGFKLESHDTADLARRDEQRASAERAGQQQQQRLETKRKADAERDDFTLSGSDRPADENPNQGDIFDGQNKLYDIGSYVGENVVKALKVGLGWAEQKVGRVLHEVTDPVFSTADGAPSAGLLDYLNRKLADNFSFVEKVQKSVGHEVEEAADAVLAQRLLAGKTGDRLRRFDDDLMAPLKQAVTTASKNKGVTLDDINDFLYARHAGERNRQVASINPGKLDGSGIADAQARDTLAKFDKAGKTAALNRIAAEFDKITAFERKALADAGLITKETLANWQRAYKHYAPLKGEESDAAFSQNGGSGGFGSQAKYGRATGRFSQASNLIERAIMNAQIAVIRAEKAEVGRAFLKFAKDNPNKELVASIDQLPTKAEIRADGSVGYKTDGLAAMSDRVMTVVDRDGASHQIVFANNEAGALLARALNGMGAKESGVVVRAMSKVSRLYAGLQTKWNPEFVVTNAMRDVQTAIGTVGSDFGHKMTGKVLADYRKAATAIVANESGGKVDFSSKEWKGWHDRFRVAGGETHFVSVDDVAAGGKILQQAVDAGYSALHPQGAWRKGAEAAGRALAVIDVANSAIENALRLSVFKNLVEAGHSEAKAAMAAKECTVNFNRHGEAGPAINAAYVFFNAAVQGQVRLVRLFKDHPAAGAKLAGTLAGLGGSLAAMNYMASGEDEDGRAFYDKVPTEVKNRWAVMMVPDGVAGTLREYAPGWMIPSEDETAGQLYLKLFPLAPGLGMFANAGAGMVEASRADNADLARSILAKRMLSTVIDSFNPFGSNSVVAQLADGEYSKAAGEFGKLVSPTAFDPFVELGLNSNFMGSAIYKEQDEKSTAPAKPNSEVAFKKTSDTSKAIARWLNSATGGDDLRAGNIDVSADKLDYIAGYVTGGAGRFVMNLGKTIGDSAEGKEPDYKRVPFARLAAGDARGAPYEHFNKAQHEVQLAAKEAGMGREANEELAALAREEKTVAAFIKQQRALLSKIQDDAGLSDDDVRERETAINRRIESRMKQFLGRYYEAGGKKLSY